MYHIIPKRCSLNPPTIRSGSNSTPLLTITLPLFGHVVTQMGMTNHRTEHIKTNMSAMICKHYEVENVSRHYGVGVWSLP